MASATDSYTAITENVRVSVQPLYLDAQSNPEKNRYFWAYTIEIQNEGEMRVQLRDRYWHITDASGHVEEVRGPGVIGEQPVIEPGELYRYTSGCPLTTTSGFMKGSYTMERHDGSRFLVEIPAFSLDQPDAPRVVN